MIAIVALCLIVYMTLPETGSRAQRASVAPTEIGRASCRERV